MQLLNTDAPSRRIFYGWWIVAACIIGGSTAPGQFAFGSLGLFIKPLELEFGWNRVEISACLTVYTFVSIFAMSLVGIFVDRLGSRRVLIASLLIFASLLAAIPLFVNELWHLILVFALMGSLGAGANSLPYMLTVSAWFDRRRGLAIGIVMAGGGLGYAYVPPLIQYLIDTAGWRSGYYALAAIIAFITLPLVGLLLRNTPEEMGLSPDGDGKSSRATAAATDVGMSPSQAFRTRQFWILILIFSFLSFSFYGLLPHIVPMLTDREMDASVAALVASSVGITIMVSRVLIGFLIDRFFAPYVAMVFFLLSAAGVAILATASAPVPVFLAAILIGFSMGAEIDLMAFLASRYFGLRHYGKIYGLLFASLLIGTSLGPISFAYVYESSGDYAAILKFCFVIVVLASVATALLPRYPHVAEAGDQGRAPE